MAPQIMTTAPQSEKVDSKLLPRSHAFDDLFSAGEPSDDLPDGTGELYSEDSVSNLPQPTPIETGPTSTIIIDITLTSTIPRPILTTYLPIPETTITISSSFRPTLTTYFPYLAPPKNSPPLTVYTIDKTTTLTDADHDETFYYTKTITNDYRVLHIRDDTTSSGSRRRTSFRTTITVVEPKTTLNVVRTKSTSTDWDNFLARRTVQPGTDEDTYTVPTATSVATWSSPEISLVPRAATHTLYPREWSIVTTRTLIGVFFLGFVIGTVFGVFLPRMFNAVREWIRNRRT
ncbi:hypothetical protein TWF696_005499 [Orbilia brochopaga]|uniref:Uncharacterized protein n=1 Tax=Orbilia brochopaga TaxID=3140254 RepID=A0AAV9V7H9_9PEZI